MSPYSILRTYLSKWTTTAGLDLDAEIEALRVRASGGMGSRR